MDEVRHILTARRNRDYGQAKILTKGFRGHGRKLFSSRAVHAPVWFTTSGGFRLLQSQLKSWQEVFLFEPLSRKRSGWAVPTPHRRINKTNAETRAGEENPTALKNAKIRRTTSVSALAVRFPMGKVYQRLGKDLTPAPYVALLVVAIRLPLQKGSFGFPLTTVTLVVVKPKQIRMNLSELLLGLGNDMKTQANEDTNRSDVNEYMHSLPTYREREKQMERLCENLSDMQLVFFALWEIHAITEGSSDAVSAELLKRSGVSEGVAKW